MIFSLPPEDVENVVRGVRVWDELRGARILLTGATGFFGRWMLESFATANVTHKLDATLTALSRRVVNYQRDDINGHAVELGKDTWVPDHNNYTHVIHLAKDDAKPFQSMVLGTHHLLGQLERFGMLKARVLLASSGAVYSSNPLNPRCSYGECKRMSEHLCIASSNPCVVARCFTFAGPGLPSSSALRNFITQAIQGDSISLSTVGDSIRSYMYASDLAVRLWTLLVNGTPKHAYDVGANIGYTIREVAETVSGLFPHKPRVSCGHDEPSDALERIYLPRTNAKGVTVPYAEAIKKTVRWCRERRGAIL